jgi:hypothetical protein
MTDKHPHDQCLSIGACRSMVTTTELFIRELPLKGDNVSSCRLVLNYSEGWPRHSLPYEFDKKTHNKKKYNNHNWKWVHIPSHPILGILLPEHSCISDHHHHHQHHQHQHHHHHHHHQQGQQHETRDDTRQQGPGGEQAGREEQDRGGQERHKETKQTTGEAEEHRPTVGKHGF